MVEAGLNFFFDTIKWVFTDFLIKVKILDISVLYYFLAIILLGIIICGLINPVSAGNVVFKSSKSRRDNDNERSK